MKTNRSLRGNDGFTLVELLVAIALLSIVGTVLFNGFSFAARTYLKTSKLQMAEDVAQEVAEVFRATPLDGTNGLLALYAEKEPDPADPGSGKLVVKAGVDTTNATTGVRTVTFNGIEGFDYDSRMSGTNGFGDYTVNVVLKSLNTAQSNEMGKVLDNPATHDSTDPRRTTYEQSAIGVDPSTGLKKTDGIFIIDQNVGTNSFILPEVKNIYDGTSVVMSSEINQFDINVAEDMLNAILNAVNAENATIGGAAGSSALSLINTYDVESVFAARYIPYTGISSAADLKKTTKFDFQQVNTAAGVKYYCLVSIKYKFNFDMPLTTVGGMAYPKHLSELMVDVDGTVPGAVTTYSVAVSGSEYTITYNYKLPSSTTDPRYIDGLSGLEASFVQEIMVPREDGSDPVYKADGSGDKLPDLFILYTPFDVYSDSTGAKANDAIELHNSIPTTGKNILRTFFVVQDTPHTKAIDAGVGKVTKVEDCTFTAGQPIPSNTNPLTKFNYQFYTNSDDIIKNSTNGITKEFYLTNSISKNHTNLYEMEIVVIDSNGVEVAKYNTVKED